MQLDVTLTLIVGPETQDGFVRLDPVDMKRLGLLPGEVAVSSEPRRCLLRVQPAFMEDRNQRLARVSPRTARNLGLKQGDVVRFTPERQRPPVAELVTLEAYDALDRLHLNVRLKQLNSFWNEHPVCVDDELGVPTLDQHELKVRVRATQPSGPVVIGGATSFLVAAPQGDDQYPTIGGLREIYKPCLALVRAREKRDGTPAAGAILLTGPAGCGKSLMVRHLAHDAGFSFRSFDVHHLLDQWLSHGSTELSLSLSEFARRGPTLLSIDHLEALTEASASDSRLAVGANAVTAQICALLEEVPTQPNIMVFAITSGSLPSRLQKDRRFDLQLDVDVPNRWGRHEVLLLATTGKALSEDVNLDELASMMPGLTPREIIRIVSQAALSATGRKIARDDFVHALRSTVPSAPGEVHCDVPSVAWRDVAGLDEVKDVLCETLSWSLHQREKFAGFGVIPPRSILLSGGRGTGKTLLVRALASYMPMPFIELGCSYLISRDQAEGARLLRSAFALARRKAPCLVFLDDLDALFEGEPNPEEALYAHPVVGQLIAELDKLSGSPDVVVIAATNRPDRLTNEILQPGRFDFALTLPMPDQASRRRIFHIHARRLPLAADVDFDKLAAVTQGFTAADIANLCNRVGLMAIRHSLSGPDAGVLPPVVNAETFEQALRGRKQSV